MSVLLCVCGLGVYDARMRGMSGLIEPHCIATYSLSLYLVFTHPLDSHHSKDAEPLMVTSRWNPWKDSWKND